MDLIKILPAIEASKAKCYERYGGGSDDEQDAFDEGYDAGMLSLLLSAIDDRKELDKQPLMDAYARYDSDPRVHGPDDFEAFRDAVRATLLELVPRHHWEAK